MTRPHRPVHRLVRLGRLPRFGVVVAAAALLAAGTPSSSYAGGAGASSRATPQPVATHAAKTEKTVLSQRTIGYSVRGRAIRAYEMGSRTADRTVVVIGAMHGNESEGSVVVSALMGGRPVRGVHVWAIRRDNPDGALVGSRRNAHGVDLNRNFPTKWKPPEPNYYPGPRPRSEPETRALMRFLDRIDPDYVVTMHSPFRGIDVYGAKDRRLARRLSENMRLPIREFDCGGGCHGTLTQWFNRNHPGACVTIEFGEHPSSRYLHLGAPRGLVRAVFGRFAPP